MIRNWDIVPVPRLACIIGAPGRSGNRKVGMREVESGLRMVGVLLVSAILIGFNH